MPSPALFLDRDGVINRRLPDAYVRHPDEFELLPDILPILVQARQHGMLLILITNQQGVGKGLMTHAELNVVHDHMQHLLQRHTGFALDAIYACTDLATTASERRKPAPGMLLEAIAEHDIDVTASWFLGDSLTDAQAGRAAGVRTILVGPFQASDADVVVPDLASVRIIAP
ncbi:MAG: HAD family hydrolase [Candidatus Kapabacteria bacterium]|nr:HAD family hydrolase [Candidatus Kapabacteria bacterium]